MAKKGRKGIDWVKLVAAIMICQLAGVVGSAFTMPAIPTWYASLNKPFFSPPSWVFAPAWITLFVLMGVSLYLVWKREGEKKGVGTALGFFGVQLILNAAWSLLFFGLRSPLLGFIGIVALWLSIAVAILKFHEVDKRAAYLLVPYILWVSFAAVVNLAVLLLNP